ncbi:MAG: cobalamin B12-binding domain-containing protein [Chloroflexi bacterium]|nr:cobalamin B12-binding domain-containing protein [Chloroflexota bacterium]
MAGSQPLRVLLTRAQVDPHDRGLRYLATRLREAGMEVIYGRYSRPEEIAAMALQEDVDAIGIGFYCIDPMRVAPEVVGTLRERGLGQVRVLVGGIIPEDERQALLAAGVAALFPPGTSAEDVIACLKTA